MACGCSAPAPWNMAALCLALLLRAAAATRSDMPPVDPCGPERAQEAQDNDDQAWAGARNMGLWVVSEAADVFEEGDKDSIERGRAPLGITWLKGLGWNFIGPPRREPRLSCVLCNLLTKTVLETSRPRVVVVREACRSSFKDLFDAM